MLTSGILYQLPSLAGFFRRPLLLLFPWCLALLGATPLRAQSCGPELDEIVVEPPVCVDQPVTFRNTSPKGGGVAYAWKWGDGESTATNAESVEYTFTEAGPRIIWLVRTVGACRDSVAAVIEVAPLVLRPRVTEQTACAQTPITLRVLNAEPGVTYRWDFRDPRSGDRNTATGTVVTHAFSPALSGRDTTYRVSVSAVPDNGCDERTSQAIVNILATPNVTVTAPGGFDACLPLGSTAPPDRRFSFVGTTTNATRLVWFWGDGSENDTTLPGQTVAHRYALGSYPLRVEATNAESGCTGRFEREVAYENRAPANVVLGAVGGSLQVCDGETFEVEVAGDNATRFVIDWGDGTTTRATTAGTYSHTYGLTDAEACGAPAAGYERTVSLSAENNCYADNSRSLTYQLRVRPRPNFRLSAPVCAEGGTTALSFTNLSCPRAPYGDAITEYRWDFDDGTAEVTQAGTETQVTHTYAAPGVYNVTLTAQNDDCGSITTTKRVVVDGDPGFVLRALNVATFFTTRNGTDCGAAEIPFLNPEPNPSFPEAAYCAGNATLFLEAVPQDSGSAGIEYNWTVQRADGEDGGFSFRSTNGEFSRFPADFLSFNESGEYIITARGTNVCGTGEQCIRVLIYDQPIVEISGIPAAVCGPARVGVQVDSIENFEDFIWEFEALDGSPTPDWPTNTNTLLLDSIDLEPGRYSLSLTAVGTCKNAVATLTVEVLPPPVAEALADTLRACGDEPIFLRAATSTLPYRYTWRSLDGGAEPNDPDNRVAEVVNITPGTYRYELRVSVSDSATYDCASLDTVVAVVSAQPVVESLGDPLSLCQGDPPVTIAPVVSNAVAGGSGTWKGFRFTASGAIEALPATIFDAGIFTPSVGGAFFVRYVFANPAGCVDSLDLNVNVVPRPGVSIDPPLTYCRIDPTTMLTVSIDDEVTGTGTWDDSVPGVSEDGTFDPSAAGAGDINLTYTFTPAGSSCAFRYDFVISVVDPGTDPLGSVNKDTVCASAPGPILPPATPSTGTWLDADGQTVDLDDPLMGINPANDSTFFFEYVLAAGSNCEIRDTFELRVKPSPVVEIAGPDTVVACSGNVAPLLLEATPLGGTWRLEDGTPLPGGLFDPNDFTADSVYLVRYTVANAGGCPGIGTVYVDVPVVPTAAFEVNDTATYCQGLEVTFSATPAALPSRYEWFFDFGGDLSQTQTGRTPRYTYDAAGTYQVALVVSSRASGCADTLIRTIEVIPLPAPRFSIEIRNGDVCGEARVYFENLTDPRSASYYVWDFGDGRTSTALQPDAVLFVADTVDALTLFPISLRAGSSCGEALFTDTVRVFPPPVARLLAVQDTICARAPLLFSNASYGSLSDFTVDWGDGSPPQTVTGLNTFTHTFDYNGDGADTSYVVTLTGSGQCGISEDKDTVTVTTNTLNAFFSVPSLRGCAPFTTQFTSNQVGGRNDITWLWGDGSITTDELAPTHEFTDAGSYDVRLVVQNGCNVDTFSRTVEVQPVPEAAFQPSSTQLCLGEALSFPSAPSDPALSYRWEFGDGTTSQVFPPPTKVYAAPGVYKVKLTVRSSAGCSDADSVEVTVRPRPTAAFSVVDDTVCLGTPVALVDGSAGAISYLWTFGNTGETSGEASPTFTFTSAGTYTVGLQVTNGAGCTNTTSRRVVVRPRPTPVIDVLTPASGCSPLTVQFADASGAPFGTTRRWAFDDGTTSTLLNPTRTFTNTTDEAQTYTVTLVLRTQAGCADTTTTQVTVLPAPVAGLAPLSRVLDQDSALFTFFNQTQPRPTDATVTWLWGDGEQTVVRNYDEQLHRYEGPGEYMVSLVVATDGGCADTATTTVTVREVVPEVAFFADDTVGCPPFAVRFTNESLFGVDYLWDFGNGQTSDDETPPPITYTRSGTYTVSLTVTNGGFTRTLRREAYVTVTESPVAGFTVNLFDPIVGEQAVRFRQESQGAESYEWNFGDGNTSDEESPSHIYRQAGTYDVTLTAINADGCADTIRLEALIKARDGRQFDIPNAFTPRGGGLVDSEGRNDQFRPVLQGVVDYRLRIFNRWGVLMFQSTDQQVGWDGYFQGQLCNQGVYIYQMNVTFSNGETVERTGDVTLLR
ncbi:MAG: PKD domain-containing protein [Catalinimonas sp.]